MRDPSLPRNRARDHFTILVVLAAAVYVLLAWSPSSYARVFDLVGLPREGLVFGEPREIREDEWVRWTPFMRAAMNNQFGRFNETSLYREDLRNVEGLPLADWGLVFKPYFWPFFLVDAAHAFSFYHAFWMAAFLVGYHRLFQTLGWGRVQAACASLALFFSGFSQLWWTTYGPVLAGFPWTLLAALAPLGPWLRAILVAGASAAWLLANLHPPIQITLGFVALIGLLAFRRDALGLRTVLPAVLGAAVGAGLVVFYYRDVFLAMAGTIYPGQREGGGGGGGVVALQWLSHFLPFFVTRGYETVIDAENVCEAATVGSWVPLLALCFIDHRALRDRLRGSDAHGRELRRRLAILSVAVALSSLWILLPVPAAVGMPLLWHVVPAKRMWFAAGLLIQLLFLALLRDAELRTSWPRWAAAAAAILASCVVSDRWLSEPESQGNYSGAWVLAPLAAVFVLRGRLREGLRPAWIACAAFANLLAFGGFNPIQSARPIFEPIEASVAEPLDRLAGRHPRGWLVLHRTSGAWLNGLGYRSATHVLFAPQLERFRSLLPELDEDTFRWVFNRSLYVFLTLRAVPEVYSEPVALVPIDVFEPPTIAVELGGDGSARRSLGFVERQEAYLEQGRPHLVLTGWAFFDGSDAESRLGVRTDLPVERAAAYPSLRPDVVRLAGDRRLLLSGFELRLDLSGSLPPEAGTEAWLASLSEHPVCVTSTDREFGRFVLRRSDGSDPCRPLARLAPDGLRDRREAQQPEAHQHSVNRDPREAERDAGEVEGGPPPDASRLPPRDLSDPAPREEGAEGDLRRDLEADGPKRQAPYEREVEGAKGIGRVEVGDAEHVLGPEAEEPMKHLVRRGNRDRVVGFDVPGQQHELASLLQHLLAEQRDGHLEGVDTVRHHDDADPTPGVLQGEANARAQTVRQGLVQRSDLGMGLGRRARDLERPVLAGVVDDQDLARQSELSFEGQQPLEDEGKVELLVQRRDDEAHDRLAGADGSAPRNQRAPQRKRGTYSRTHPPGRGFAPLRSRTTC